MIPTVIYSVLGLLAVILLWSVVSVGRGVRKGVERLSLDQARLHFLEYRDDLIQLFYRQASESGRPRGLRWVHCDFAEDTTFARDVHAGELRALVAVTIQFEAIEGGDMEEVEAVGNLRAATAVFVHDGQQWSTAGRTVFNHDPLQTLERFAHELEPFEKNERSA